MSSGIGIYQDDYDSSIVTEIDKDESKMDVLSRVSSPNVEETIQLENMHFLTVSVFIARLVLMMLKRGLVLLKDGLKTVLKSVSSTDILLSPDEKQTKMVAMMHRNKLLSKLSSVSKLPTYYAQDEEEMYLQELGYDTSEEQDRFMLPSDCHQKIFVPLQLDIMKRPHVTLHVHDEPITFLVDSGAAMSVLRHTDFLKIPNHDSLPRGKERVEIRDHQQRIIPVMFTILVPATVGGKVVTLNLLVCKRSASNVLGMDTIVGRSLIFTHRGSEAFLIVGELGATQRPIMKIRKRMGLFVLKNTIIPAESTRKIEVSPFVFPMRVDIDHGNFRIEYAETLDGIEGLSKRIKLDDDGNAIVRLKNTTIIDRELSAEEVIGWAFLEDKENSKNKSVTFEEGTPSKIKEEKSSKTEVMGSSKIEDARSSKSSNRGQTAEDITLDLKVIPNELPSIETLETADSTKFTTCNSKENDVLSRSQVSKSLKPFIPKKVSCFCALTESNLILRGNCMGDTNIPFLTYGGFRRERSGENSCQVYHKDKRKVSVIYSNKEAELEEKLKKIPQDEPSALIVNRDSYLSPNIPSYIVVGKCPDHPFPYHVSPTYLSLVTTETKNEIHQEMIQELNQQVRFLLFDTWVQGFWSEKGNQVHFILHVPSVRATHKGWLENFISALVKPFEHSLRIIEVYNSNHGQGYASMIFNNAVGNLSRFFSLTLQSRSPHLERLTYPINTQIHECNCGSCLQKRDHEIFQRQNVHNSNL